MDRQELIDDIKSSLGAPVVHLEIDEAVWDKIINKAKRWFRAKKGFITQTLVDIQPNENEYDWPADATAIVDVIMPRRTDISDILSLGFFDIVPAQMLATANQYPSLHTAGAIRFETSAYVQLLQSLEIRRRVFSADPGWTVMGPPIKKIYLTPRDILTSLGNSDTPAKMIVYYKKQDFDITDFIGRDEDLFYRYCEAKAKMVLGRIRSKYPTYPSAGGSITMDGSELIAEAKEELRDLEEEISESQGNAGGILVG
jgi:hypothetical protein